MKPKTGILLIIACVAITLAAVGYFLFRLNHEDVLQVLVSTDRQEYHAGDSIHVSIQNFEDRPVDIYCPESCALGNFPTTLERFTNGDWEYFAGFCPSIEPLFGSGVQDGNYIRHTLSPGSAFELELYNLEALHLEQDVTLRVKYFMRGGRTMIYSNNFTVRP